jgi:nitrite reductase/ring-hydroxylating ferredoxin subunit
MDYVKAAETDELRPGQSKFVRLDSTAVLLVNVDGTIYALSNLCTHSKCYLHQGKLKGKVIICPCHFAEFDVTTGAVLNPPAKEPLPVYAVRIESRDILVAI